MLVVCSFKVVAFAAVEVEVVRAFILGFRVFVVVGVGVVVVGVAVVVESCGFWASRALVVDQFASVSVVESVVVGSLFWKGRRWGEG